MALQNKLKLKLKSNLKQSIQDEGNSKKKDTRILNYYDLKFDEKMRVLFVPDVNGELWLKFRKHGPNLDLRGAGSIRCLHEATGEPCEVCQRGFEYLNLEKETGDKSYKDEAKRWFAKDYTHMSAIVLESPMEIQESPDKNEVKIFLVPFSIEKKIKEAINEGQLSEDELCQTPFVIKKTKNNGGFAEYSSSYFERRGLEDGDLDFLDDLVVEQFDYTEIDLLPPVPTEEEIDAWLEKAVELDEKKSGSTDDDDGLSTQSQSRGRERAPSRERAPAREPETVREEKTESREEKTESRSRVTSRAPSREEEEPEARREPEAPAEEAKTPAGGGSLRDRLSRIKK